MWIEAKLTSLGLTHKTYPSLVRTSMWRALCRGSMNNASGVAKDVDLTQRVKRVAYTDEESPWLYTLHR
jgi:hypothetical protein